MNRQTNDRDDLAALLDEFSDVKPLKSPERSDSRVPPPAPLPRQLERDEQAVMSELLDLPEDFSDLESGEELLFLRPGIQNRFLTRLRKGRYSVGDTLDLHQMNESTASMALKDFIDQSVIAGIGCVRVIHGKGLRSKKVPKLKAMTRRLLSRHPRVVAFASCRPVDGGTGAVNVLLKAGKSVPGRP